MAYTCTIDPAEALARVTVTGVMNASDCRTVILAVAEDPLFEESTSVVADLRSMDYHPSSSDIEQLCKVLVDMRDRLHGRIGVIVPDKVMLFAARLACMFTAPAGIVMKAFLVPEEAADWCSMSVASRGDPSPAD